MNAPVLLLDAAWRIDRVIGVQTACELLIDRKVVPASADIAMLMRSPTLTVEVPSVVARVGPGRIVGFQPPACTPRRVRLRDDHQCQFVVDGIPCGRRGSTVDHLVPRSKFGPSTFTNLVAACVTHNSAKADATLDEMCARHGWVLRRTPAVPTRASLLVAGIGRAQPGWGPFLAAAI